MPELSPFELMFGEFKSRQKAKDADLQRDITRQQKLLEAQQSVRDREREKADQEAIDKMALKVLDENPDAGMSYDAARIEAGKRVRDMQFNRAIADATTAEYDKRETLGKMPNAEKLGGAKTTAQLAEENLKAAKAGANLISQIPALHAQNYRDEQQANLDANIARRRIASAPAAAEARDTLDLDTALNLSEKARTERPRIPAITTATMDADMAELFAKKGIAEGQAGNQQLANDAEAAALREKYAASNYGAQNPQFIRRYNPLATMPSSSLIMGALLEGAGGVNGIPTTATSAPTTPDSLNSTPLRFKSTGQSLR